MSDEDQRSKVRGQIRYVIRVVPNTGINPNKKSEKLSTAVLGIPGLETPCGHNPMIPSLHPALAMVESGQRVYMSCTQCPPDSEMVQEVIRNAVTGNRETPKESVARGTSAAAQTGYREGGDPIPQRSAPERRGGTNAISNADRARRRLRRLRGRD